MWTTVHSSLSEIYQVNPKAIPNLGFCAVQFFYTSPSSTSLFLSPGARRRAIANDLCWQQVLMGEVQWIWSQTDLGMHLNIAAIFFHQHFDTGDSYYLRVSWQFILQVEMRSFCFKKMKSPSRTSAFFSTHLISHTQIWDFFLVNKHNLLSAMVKIFWHKVIQST